MLQMHEYNIGNTSLIRMPDINGNRIYIKAEGENVLGSIKARTGYYIIRDLPGEADGKTIIESTSGNLGLSLGYFCKETGRKFLALIDPTVALSKIERLKELEIAYMCVDAENGLDHRSSRIKTAEIMTLSDEYYWVNQYHNNSGIMAHECTTAPEIWKQTEQKLTHVICAMGSCGTICGIGRFLHRYSKKVRVIGVEPYGSTIFGDMDGNYLNAGAGLAGKPGNLVDNPDTVDEAYTVHDKDSLAAARMLWQRYHFDAGVTTGMAFYIAEKIAQKETNGCIVVISADGREAYGEYL